jgi:hypothetical protein
MVTGGSQTDGGGESVVMDVQKLIDSAVEAEQYCAPLAADRGSGEPGVIFRGVSIVGFSSIEEEQLIAYMSRIPPELIVNVKEVVADSKLDAIHGRYDDKAHVVHFNPHTFLSKVRLGRGEGKINHAQLTVLHEFGHALYNSLPEKVRDAWRELSGWMLGTQEGQERPYVEKRPGWPHKTSGWTHRKGAEFTRHYAEKNDDEDFADTFAFCLLSKPAQAGSVKRKWMGQLLMSLIQKYPQASIEGPE